MTLAPEPPLPVDTLLDFQGLDLLQVIVVRGHDLFDVILVRAEGAAPTRLSLRGCTEVPDVAALFQASRILITVNRAAQLEFGRVHIEVWLEAHYEFWAGALESGSC